MRINKFGANTIVLAENTVVFQANTVILVAKTVVFRAILIVSWANTVVLSLSNKCFYSSRLVFHSLMLVENKDFLGLIN